METRELTSSEFIALLRNIEQRAGSGELTVIAGERRAKLYVQKGSALWAYATGQRENFQSILLREGLVSKEDLVEGIRASREQAKRGLDEILVVIGIGDPDIRYEVRRRHTISALEAIYTWERIEVRFAAGDYQTKIPVIPLSSFAPPAARTGRPTAAPAGALRAAPRERETAAPVSTLPELLRRLREDVTYFRAAVVLDYGTAMPLASESAVEVFDPEVASAFYRDVIRSAEQASDATTAPEEPAVEELLLQTKHEYVFLKCLTGRNEVLCLFLERNSNPAIARAALKKLLVTLPGVLDG